jgi:hypothetical protein
MVADSFQPLCVGGEAALPTRGADVRLDSIRLVLWGRVARPATIWSRYDLDGVIDLAHALHSRGNLLSDLLEVLGGKATPQMECVAVYDASDVAKREVLATSNANLGLAADHRSVGSV